MATLVQYWGGIGGDFSPLKHTQRPSNGPQQFRTMVRFYIQWLGGPAGMFWPSPACAISIASIDGGRPCALRHFQATERPVDGELLIQMMDNERFRAGDTMA